MRYRKAIRPYTQESNANENNKTHSRNPSQQENSCDQVCCPQEKDHQQSSDKKAEH